MTGRSTLRAALLGSCTLLLPTFTMAQTAATEDTELGTIVLQTKRDVQTDTSVAVTEIDQEEIDDRQASTIAELIDSVPGVTLINGNTPLGSGINIRGFGGGNTYGSNQKVLITIDGATQGSEELYRLGTQLFTDPDLYKNVSVIRGTAGSFEYGSGVVGGVVQLETKDASDFTNGEIGYKLRQGLSFGSNGDGITSSTILAWQPTENLEFLASYVWRRQGEQVDGDGDLLGAEGFKTPSYLLKAKYTFGAAGDQYVSLNYSDTQLAERDVVYDAISDLPHFGNVDRDVHSRTTVLTYGWTPEDNQLIDLTVALSYADQRIDQTGVPVGNATTDADHRYETTKLTVKNVARFALGSIQNELRAGVELIHKDRLTASSAPGGTDERLAFFLINEFDFGNGLTVTPALRFETQEATYKGAANVKIPVHKFENDALMGGIDARYEFANGFAAFGGVSYTESLPILDDFENQAFNRNGVIANYLHLLEQARTWEIGASYRGADVFASGDALSLKANYYDTSVWNVTSESDVFTVGMRGLEVEGAFSLANGVYSELSANIVSASSYTVLNAPLTPKIFGDADFYKYAPTDTLRLSIGKRWDEELDLNWEMVAARRYAGGDVAAPISGYGIHNLRATYRPQQGVLEGTEVRLGIENVLDRDYRARLATRDAVGRNVKLSIVKTF